MSIELEPEEPVQIPRGWIWRPEWIPPVCPAGCVVGCEPLYGITIYDARPHFGHTDGKGNIMVVCASVAYEYYFDRYGCRRDGPPPRRDNPATICWTQTVIRSDRQPTNATIWDAVKRDLARCGAPKPGHVRLLPKWRDALTHLAALRGYLR